MKIKIKKYGVFLLIFAFLFSSALLVYLFWNPGPETTGSYDIHSNGIWVGHKWYSGYNVHDGKAVTDDEIDTFIETLKKNHIKYVYIHTGPFDTAGSIGEFPGDLFTELRRRTPDIIYLPWMGGNANTLPMHNKAWRSQVLSTLGKLHGYGFNGVHLDIEPVQNKHTGYIELLKDIRTTFDGDFFISHATRRVAPWGLGIFPFNYNFWSKKFYVATMEYADQTVLMAYDTCIKFQKVYIAYVKQQTGFLVRWASRYKDHTVLIGVPSYEDVAQFSDPEIENIKNASLGVRSALEKSHGFSHIFKGVSVYANWVTDMNEWKDYRDYWLRPVN